MRQDSETKIIVLNTALKYKILRPDVRDRQTDRRQTASSLNAPWHNNSVSRLHRFFSLPVCNLFVVLLFE